eukprot:3110909-Pyramimonas_sp.AAC.1
MPGLRAPRLRNLVSWRNLRGRLLLRPSHPRAAPSGLGCYSARSSDTRRGYSHRGARLAPLSPNPSKRGASRLHCSRSASQWALHDFQ